MINSNHRSSNLNNRYHEKVNLFTTLKQTVECILSKRSSNIWNVYGGFHSMVDCLDNILQHGYKPVSKKNHGGDFWPFVKNLEWLDLTSTSFSYHQNTGSFLSNSTTTSSSEKKMGRKWVEYNLRELTIYRRLQILLSNTQLVKEYYQDWSFLLDSHFLKAFFTSIKALESNNPSILANLSPQMFGQQLDYEEDKPNEVEMITDNFDLLDQCKPTSHHQQQEETQISLLNDNLQEGTTPQQQLPLFYSSDDEEMIQISTYTRSYCPSIQQSMTCDDNNMTTSSTFLPDVIPSVEKSSTSTGRSSTDSNNPQQQHYEDSSSSSAFKLYSSSSSHIYGSSVDTTVVDERMTAYNNDVIDDDNLFPSAAVGFYDSNSSHQSTTNLVDFLRNQDLATCADVDKENAHFYFADIMIATLEQMKCNYVAQCRKLQQQQCNNNMNQQQQCLQPTTSQQSGHMDHHHHHQEDVTTTEVETTSASSSSFNQPIPSSSTASSSSVSKFHFGREQQQVHNNSERKFTHHRHTSSHTAELIAIGLLQSVSTPSTSLDQMKWLISEDDVPQKLLPIPNSVVVDCNMVSISSHWNSPVDHRCDSPQPPPTIRIRGNQEWAPPRNQIIVKAPQKLGLKKSMEKQNNRCAGCGTLINKGAFKRLRYCEYLGKYFCTCCHENRTSIIPANVLQNFDFHKYKVSNFSFDHLERMYEEPLYNIADINSKLYKKNKSLGKIRKLREQLPDLNIYIRSCRFITQSSTEHSCEENDMVSCSPIYLFSQLPPHFLTNEFDIFSIDDLVQCRNNELLIGLNLAHQVATEHLEKCQLCRMKGFICELCNNSNDIIFSHQLHTITCGECKSCYHIKCYQHICPKCQRIKKRKIILQNRNGEN